jgi:hypothetical protein
MSKTTPMLWITRAVFVVSAAALVVCGWAKVGQDSAVPLLMVFIAAAVCLAFWDASRLLMSLIFLAPFGPEYSLATLQGGASRIQSSGYANAFSFSAALYDFVIGALAIAWLVRRWRKEVALVFPAPLRWAFIYVGWVAISLAYASVFITSTSQVIVRDPILGFDYSFALGPAQIAVAFLYAIKLAEVMLVGLFAATFYRSDTPVEDVARYLVSAGVLLAVVGTFHTIRIQNALPGLGWPSVRLDDGVFLIMAIGTALLLLTDARRRPWLTAGNLLAVLVMAFFVSLIGKRGAALGVFSVTLTTLVFSWRNRMVVAGAVLGAGVLAINPAPLGAYLFRATTSAEPAPTLIAKEPILNPLIRRSVEGPKSDFGEGIGWSHSGAYTIADDSVLNWINRKIGFDYSIKNRVIQQLRAFRFFREHMISGVGFHTSVYRGIGITDNQAMSTAVETGIIGVLLLAGAVLSTLALAWRGLKSRTREGVFFGKLVLATAMGLLAVSLSSEVLYLYRAMVSFWFVVGIAWFVIERHPAKARPA